MLGFPARHTPPPILKGPPFQVSPHQRYNTFLIDLEQLLDGFKGRSIFPSHLDNAR
jgi:hypothetical protein